MKHTILAVLTAAAIGTGIGICSLYAKDVEGKPDAALKTDIAKHPLVVKAMQAADEYAKAVSRLPAAEQPKARYEGCLLICGIYTNQDSINACAKGCK